MPRVYLAAFYKDGHHRLIEAEHAEDPEDFGDVGSAVDYAYDQARTLDRGCWDHPDHGQCVGFAALYCSAYIPRGDILEFEDVLSRQGAQEGHPDLLRHTSA